MTLETIDEKNANLDRIYKKTKQVQLKNVSICSNFKAKVKIE